MNRGLFVTGTDTNVGKTAISAALICRYRPHMAVRYWKPIQTGAPEDDDTSTVRQMANCSDPEIHGTGIRLPLPLSPHLSARRAGKRIDIQSVLSLAHVGNGWIVEGAGGVLVPLNEKEMMIDLISALGIAAVVVARTSLGAINHTLLTIEALRSRSIPIAGVVLNGEPNADNREAIETYGRVQILGEMPRFAQLSHRAIGEWAQRWLDPESRLEEFLK